jgi:hypothetical protein
MAVVDEGGEVLASSIVPNSVRPILWISLERTA